MKEDDSAVEASTASASEENLTVSPSESKKPSRVAFMLRALSSRNYRLFFSGQLVSLLGNWMTQIATSWLVYRLTGSPLLLGAVGFAGQIPAFILSPIAGVWVDRWPRQQLLVITQVLAMVQTLALAILALSGHIVVWHIIVLMIFKGFINAFDMPARQAFVVELVENKADLSNAIALNSSMFNLARLLGPSIGGLLIALVGEGLCFLIDGLSYIGVIISLMMIKVPALIEKKQVSPIQQLLDGCRYAFGFPPIRAIIFLIGSVSLMGMPYAVLMPIIADKVLGGGPGTLGILMAFSGVGALTSALILAARKSVRGLSRLIPISTAVFGMALLVFSYSSWLWLSLIAITIMGYAMIQQNAACNTILQTIVDPDKRGRVMSLYTMSFMGMMPLGSLWAGALAERIGAQKTLYISGLASIGIAFWFYRKLPGLGEYIRPIYLRMGIIPKVPTSQKAPTEQLKSPRS